MAKRPPELVLEELSKEDMRNVPYVSAHLAVASLTVAGHYVLRVEGRDKAAQDIERALESTVRLRERLRKKSPPKNQD